jgi:hypothetical protein
MNEERRVLVGEMMPLSRAHEQVVTRGKKKKEEGSL